MDKWLDKQSRLVKILLFIPVWGWAVGVVYRIFKYVANKQTNTLIFAILGVIPPIGFVISIIDLIMVIVNDKVSFFAD